MPKPSGVCEGCAERGCVPLPGQGSVSNHPLPTLFGSQHPHQRGHITTPGSWNPPPRGHTTPPPILSPIIHLPGVIAPILGYICNLPVVILPTTHLPTHLLRLISPIPGPISHHPPTQGYITHLPTMPRCRSHTRLALPLGGRRMKPTPPRGCPHPALTPSARCRWAGPQGGRQRRRP